jgi:hypothetical protein
VIFINDLPDNIAKHIKLYADYRRIIGIIESEEDAGELQKDIDAAVNWSHKWLMPFNIEKCKVMYVGRVNRRSNRIYQMKNADGSLHDLAETTLERDLGVLTSSDLKLKVQVEAAASMANRALGRLKRHSEAAVSFFGERCTSHTFARTSNTQFKPGLLTLKEILKPSRRSSYEQPRPSQP